MTKHDANRKQRILDHIAETLRKRGYPPSVREIAKAVGLASTSAVHHHLEQLEREGYLERGATQSRALRLTPSAALRSSLTTELLPQVPPQESRQLVVMGEIAAGLGIEPYQDASETMAVPDVLAPAGDAYLLRVRGDSMIGDHIRDGDYVVVRPQATAHNGDIVVALREDDTATLKRFYKEADAVRLQPANDQVPVIRERGARVQGKVIGLIRRLD